MKGDSTCSTFVAARDEGRRGDNRRVNEYADWMAGYLTANSVFVPDTYDILGSSDMNAVLLWLENYCKQNPLNTFAAAAEAVTAALYPKRTRNSPKQ